MIRKGLKYSIFLYMVVSISSWAGESDINPSKMIPLFLKIITYDENFNKENTDEIVIFVIHDISRPESYEQLIMTEMYISENENLSIKDIPVKFKPIRVSQSDSVIKSTSASNYNMIIVTDIGEDKIKDITSKTRESKVRSFSLCPEYIALGLSISVDPTRKSKAILVNLESSKLEGSKFSAHLLKMCEIY